MWVFKLSPVCWISNSISKILKQIWLCGCWSSSIQWLLCKKGARTLYNKSSGTGRLLHFDFDYLHFVVKPLSDGPLMESFSEALTKGCTRPLGCTRHFKPSRLYQVLPVHLKRGCQTLPAHLHTWRCATGPDPSCTPFKGCVRSVLYTLWGYVWPSHPMREGWSSVHCPHRGKALLLQTDYPRGQQTSKLYPACYQQGSVLSSQHILVEVSSFFQLYWQSCSPAATRRQPSEWNSTHLWMRSRELASPGNRGSAWVTVIQSAAMSCEMARLQAWW